MSSTGGIRSLVGKLFGRDGSVGSDPFADTAAISRLTIPPLLSPEQLEAFAHTIGYPIVNNGLFILALIHRSYLQLIDEANIESNERLEFLGDSILNMLIGEFLFRHYRDVQEGELTKLRSRLVNKKALIHGAEAIGLEKYVLVNASAEQSLRQGNKAIVADAFEAVVAAIYIDAGLDLHPVKEFLQRTLLHPATFEKILETDENYKSALLEMAQGEGHRAPRYNVASIEGPDHERTFTVEAIVGGDVVGVGQGRSKKKAEQQAAYEAIVKLFGEDALSGRDDGVSLPG